MVWNTDVPTGMLGGGSIQLKASSSVCHITFSINKRFRRRVVPERIDFAILTQVVGHFCCVFHPESPLLPPLLSSWFQTKQKRHIRQP